jgi:hypothetical protein
MTNSAIYSDVGVFAYKPLASHSDTDTIAHEYAQQFGKDLSRVTGSEKDKKDYDLYKKF